MSVMLPVAATATLMQALPLIAKALDNANSPDNLIQQTAVTRNDFLTLVEDDLLALPYLPDVMQSVLSIVSGYFLSAVSLVVDVPGIEVQKTLGRLNTTRDPMESVLGTGSEILKTFGTESLQYGLPAHNIAIECFAEAINAKNVGLEAYYPSQFDNSEEARIEQIALQLNQMTEKFEEEKKLNKQRTTSNNTQAQHAKEDQARRAEMHEMQKVLNEAQLTKMRADGASSSALNAMKAQQSRMQMSSMQAQMSTAEMAATLSAQLMELKIEGQRIQNQQMAQKNEPSKMSFGNGTIDTLKEITNLSVGKVFNVRFARNGNELEVPVTISLAVTNTDATSVKNILTFNAASNSFKERRYRAKAGELKYIKDLFFCQDMIEEAAKARIRDKSGFYESMMNRNRKNFWSGLLSLQPSLNNASAVLVVSEQTAKNCQLELGGSLDNFTVRERVFKNTAAMLLVVIDTKWETVRIYHRSLKASTELSVRELKRSAKGGGSDVEDILKAYSAGSAPVL